MKKKKAKKIYMTDKMLKEIKLAWYDRGKRQTKREIGQTIADLFGLYEIFETYKEED